MQLHCEKMIAAGAAQAVSGRKEFCDWYARLKNDPAYCGEMGKAAERYCKGQGGVAETIAEIVMA